MKKIYCLVGLLLFLNAIQVQAEKKIQLEVIVAPASQYGPVKKGEALWRIAGQLRPNKKISHQQMMLALLRHNPQAFRLPCNLHTLLPQSILQIPAEAEIKQLSIQQATTQFAAQEAQWKLQRWDIVCDEKFPLKMAIKPAISNDSPDKQARNSLADTSNPRSPPQKKRVELLAAYLPDTQATTQPMLDQSNLQAQALDNPFPFKPLTPDTVADNNQRQDIADTSLIALPSPQFPKKADITADSTQFLGIVLQNILMLLGLISLFVLPFVWLRRRQKRLYWQRTRAQMRQSRRQATLKRPRPEAEKKSELDNTLPEIITPSQVPTTVRAQPIMTVEIHEAVEKVVLVERQPDFNAPPVETTAEAERADVVAEQHGDKSETIDPITRSEAAQLEPADAVSLGQVMADELDDLLADNAAEDQTLENAVDEVHIPFNDSDFDALDDNIEALDADSFNELLSFSDEKSIK